MRSRSPRCSVCRLRSVLCLCAEAPRLTLPTEVVIVSHPAEKIRTTNTARLVHQVLTRCQWLWRDGRASLALPENAVLLFPGPNAVELDYLPSGVALVVPDGTWSQVTKMIRRDRDLARLPQVALPPGGSSTFRLRESPHVHGLCTYEAVSRALGILHGGTVEHAMAEVFEKMVERTLWSRGRLQPNEMRHPLPAAALAWDRLCGARNSVSESGFTPSI